MKCLIFLLLLPLGMAADGLSSHTQLGFDTELGARNLHWLIPYFDIEYLERRVDEKTLRGSLLTPEILEDYVLERAAFESLPTELKQKLSVGLSLNVKPKLLSSDAGKLLNSQGEKISAEKKLVLASSLTKLESMPAIALQAPAQKWEKTPSLILPDHVAPARSDWAVLNARWNQLPLAEKQAAVKITKINNVKIAELILALPVEGKNVAQLNEYLKLRPNAPDWLNALDYSLDGSEGHRPIEFALKGPEKNKERAFEILNSFFRETRTTAIRQAPHKFAQNDTAFHLHIGLTSDAPHEMEQGLESVLLEYRRLLAIRMLAAGRHNDSIMLPEDMNRSYVVQTAYDRFHRDGMLGQAKGLVRLVRNEPHVEIREQTMSPADTYREFMGLLEKGPEEARKDVSAKITQLMRKDPSIARRIADLNPALLPDFAEALPEGMLKSTILKHAGDRDFVGLLGKLIDRRPSPAMYDLLLELREAMPDKAMLDVSFLYARLGADKRTQQHILSHLERHPQDAPINAYRQIMDWSGSKVDKRIDWLEQAKTEKARLRLLNALVQDYWLGNEANQERERLLQVIDKIYSPGAPLDRGAVSAKYLQNALRKPSTTRDEEVLKLAKQAIWEEDINLSRNAIQILSHTKDLFSADALRRGGASIVGVSEYLTLPHLDDFVSYFADLGPEQSARSLNSVREIVAVAGPMPKGKLQQIEAILKSENKVLRAAAAKLLPVLRGEAAGFSVMPSSVISCQENFAKIQ